MINFITQSEYYEAEGEEILFLTKDKFSEMAVKSDSNLLFYGLNDVYIRINNDKFDKIYCYVLNNELLDGTVLKLFNSFTTNKENE